MNGVVIIGADGFIGRKLTLYFANRGMFVYAFVYKEADYSALQKLVNVECIPFTFQNLLNVNYSVENVSYLYNLAWEGVDATKRNNIKTQLRNIQYNIEVLDFAKKYNISKVIVSGSAAEFALNSAKIDGYGRPAPSDLYGSVKTGTYFICNAYAKKIGVGYIWTLITSIYGPGRDDNNIISYAIKSLLKGEKPLFTRLEQKWDFIYIDDLIEALFLVGEKGKAYEVYPIGTGMNNAMVTYIETIRDIIDSELPLGIGHHPYKNSVIDNQEMNIEKLKTDTGFIPKYDFEQGILNTIDYFKFHNRKL